MAVAGGIGASVGNTGSIGFDRDLIRRMKMQDLVVMFLLLRHVKHCTIALRARHLIARYDL